MKENLSNLVKKIDMQVQEAQIVPNKMDISNLSDTGFKTLVISMLKELSEDFSSIKKIQSEMKDTLNEMEISKLSDAEFKTLVIRCSKNLVRTLTA